MEAEHPDTLKAVRNLAIVLSNQGDLAAARAMYERTLAAEERTLGVEHPSTLATMGSLAAVLLLQGELAAAQEMFERTREGQESALGAAHPDTLRTMGNVAALLANQGDLDAARPLFERELEVSEQTLGAAHPGTLSAARNMAQLLDMQGETDAAAELRQRFGLKMPTKREVSGSWTAPSLAGGCPKYATWPNNPQFALVPSKAGTFTVTVSQPQSSAMLAIGVIVLYGEAGKPPDPQIRREHLVGKSKYKAAQSQKLEIKLEVPVAPMRYIVLPSTFEPGHEGSFTIEVASNDDSGFTLEPHVVDAAPAGGLAAVE